MTTGETQANSTKQRPKIEEDFKQLPLDEKLNSLFRMEAAALEETFTYVADASVKVFNKAAEVLDEFGNRVSAEFNKNRSSSSTAEAKADEPEAAKPKAGKKKAAKPGPETNVNG